jgi:hypothetical protein
MAQAGNEIAVPNMSNQPGVNLVALPMAQVGNIAKVMAASGMFPDIQKDGAKAFVKILAGQEMGIAPFEAMGGISIIQGKATIGGNIMAAKVKGSGKYDYKIRKRDREGCSIEFFEKNAEGKWESLGTETFDKEDANAAQLAGKDMWKKYPKNMYFNRAISNGVRTYCPDVLGSGPVYTPEEMGAPVDEDGNAILAPGVTYSQDTPESRPGLPASASDSTPESSAPVHIPREGNPLQLISDDLELKGFANKHERGQIALRFAEVNSFNELTRERWFDVLDRIVDTDAEDLAGLLAPVDEVIEHVAPTEEEEDMTASDTKAVESVFGEVEEIPTTPTKTAKKAPIKRPKQSQLIKLEELYQEQHITSDKGKETFNQQVIGKNYPSSSDDYEALINALEKGDSTDGDASAEA